MRTVAVFILLAFTLLVQCTSADKNTDKAEGLALMEQKCYSCHHPTASESARLAPPMLAVKKHYLEQHPSREAFTSAFVSFSQQPEESKSLMPHAVARFGLMPAMNFSEDELTAMADYLYKHDIEGPDWLEDHFKGNHGKNQGSVGLTPLEKGQELALQTKSVLGKNLMGAIQKGGPTHALEFCNTRAIHLTDSMSQELGYKIKRVSDQPRNPDNRANEAEMAYISRSKELLQKGEKLKGMIDSTRQPIVAYYPIMTNDLCMNCHAPRDEMKAELLAALDNKYPEDEATGYATGELRGIWVVEMGD
jgi:mono/diheme cytochrome c family protein